MANLNIQIISRAESYLQSREDSWSVYNSIHGQSGWNLARIDGSGEDFLAMTIEAISTPAYIGQDENGYFEHSINYIFRLEEGSCSP
jgi:hypothetical protein